MKKNDISSLFILQVVLALMLLSYGLLAIQGYNSSGSELLRGVNKVFGRFQQHIPYCFRDHSTGCWYHHAHRPCGGNSGKSFQNSSYPHMSDMAHKYCNEFYSGRSF